MIRLKKRAEFLRTAKGVRAARRAFVLQGRRGISPDGPARFGFTVTKRIGNAVERNRIRRRLKAAVERTLPAAATGCDYVLIGRRDALSAPFEKLTQDLAAALATVHKGLTR